MRATLRWALAGLLGSALAGPAAAFTQQVEVDTGPRQAVFRALDKVTARVAVVEAMEEEAVAFGSLELMVRSCAKRPPEETPEVTAFVEVRDSRAPEEEALVFSGWMFASSPGLSALEHPVYDVWLIDCKTL
jgi:hypothetical protein